MDKLLFSIIGALAVVVGGLIWKLYLGGKPAPENIDAGKIREEVRYESENTSASDLVDAAPNAADLRSDAAGIAERAKQRFRDRTGKIVSRFNGTGNNDGGGRGN
jgi:hypothetical protein